MKEQRVRVVETMRGTPDDNVQLEKEINRVIDEEAGYISNKARVVSLRTVIDGNFYLTTILFEELKEN